VSDEAARVRVPEEAPMLGDRGARALLRILVAAALDELGPEWRSIVRERARDDRDVG